MATVLIVEDELLIANGFENDVRLLRHQVIGKVTTGEAAIKFVEKQVPDIVLMDISLDSPMTGIEAAQQIRKNYTIGTIYLTSLKNALEDTSQTPPPYSFLDKPVDRRKLKIALLTMENQVHEIRKLQAGDDSRKISLPDVKGVRFELHLNDVVYVKANRSQCMVFTTKGQSFLSMTLKDFIKKYPHSNFVRVHKSYMVNASKIRGVISHKIHIKDFLEEKGTVIRIGLSYQEPFYKRFPHFRR